MNYLSHFVAESSADDPYICAGLLLPDLARSHISRVTTPAYPENSNQSKLFAGCQLHYQADTRFHASPFFLTYFDRVSTRLKQVQFSEHMDRRWFMAHIVFEMLLDRMLLRSLPNLSARYYTCLRKIDSAELSHFLIAQNARDIDGFLRKFEHFRISGYLAGYVNNDLFAFSVSRVMRYAASVHLTENDKWLLMDAVVELETEFMHEWAQIYPAIKWLMYA